MFLRNYSDTQQYSRLLNLFQESLKWCQYEKWYIYDIYIICATEAKPCVFTNAGTRLWTEVSRYPTPDPQPDIASPPTKLILLSRNLTF